mgnify:CR=1 FL=1
MIATPEGPELASISKEMRDVFSRGTAALRERLEATRTAEGIPLRYQVWRVTLRPA